MGRDHGVLEPAEQMLGFLQAQADRLEASSLLSIRRITSSRITVSPSLTIRSWSWTRTVDGMLDVPRT
jgi:hypothetical protein